MDCAALCGLERGRNPSGLALHGGGARECLQVLGDSAYTSDNPVERNYREARSFAAARPLTGLVTVLANSH